MHGSVTVFLDLVHTRIQYFRVQTVLQPQPQVSSHDHVHAMTMAMGMAMPMAWAWSCPMSMPMAKPWPWACPCPWPCHGHGMGIEGVSRICFPSPCCCWWRSALRQLRRIVVVPVVNKLSLGGEDDLNDMQKKVQQLAEETAVALKKNVYKNYSQFIETAREISNILLIGSEHKHERYLVHPIVYWQYFVTYNIVI